MIATIKKVKRRIEDLSPLQTAELLSPHINLCSNKEIFIEGCSGIIEYNTSLVRINCKDIILKITGTELTIKSDTTEQINVYGNILSLDFTGV